MCEKDDRSLQEAFKDLSGHLEGCLGSSDYSKACGSRLQRLTPVLAATLVLSIFDVCVAWVQDEFGGGHRIKKQST